MSTRAKGRRFELEFSKILKQRGYAVEVVRPSTTYVPKVGHTVSILRDFFGAFDIIAICPSGEVRLIQVTADTKIKRRLDAMKKLTNIPDYMKFLCVWRKGRKVYSLIDINGNVVCEYNKKGEIVENKKEQQIKVFPTQPYISYTSTIQLKLDAFNKQSNDEQKGD